MLTKFSPLLSASLLFTSTFLDAKEPPLMQAEMKGLLIMQLPNGSHAGTASQMNATAIPVSDKNAFGLRFNQSTGPMMTAATAEVQKLMLVRNRGKLPTGHIIEFGFANKHTLKDGPSAAVACALMAESVITGVELDPSFAVTGDLTATGEVRPIGGVSAKVRGATNKGCDIMGVPKKNIKSVHDLYVTNGVEAVVATQLILIDTFDEALQVAKLKKDEDVAQAVEDFKMVQKAIANDPRNASHPKVIEKLKSVLNTLPNHESARLVALHGSGRKPKKLSLVGSLNNIQEGASQLASIIQSGQLGSNETNQELAGNVFRLRGMRSALDPRTTDYLDAFLETAQFFKQNSEKKYLSATMERDLNAALQKIETEERKLLNSKEVQEEMMSE